MSLVGFCRVVSKKVLSLVKTTIYSIVVFAGIVANFTTVFSQEVVDKTVATVSDGVQTELITYSDLMWQLALVPGGSLKPPTSADLNRALELIIRQRLIALDAERLPSAEPTEKEVNAEIARVLALFPNAADFRMRLRAVGFTSVSDENFQRMMRQRVAIEKYLEFRFRSFVVVTPEEEKKYYDDVWVPNFKRQRPGVVVPEIDTVRSTITRILTEQQVETDIETFLDNARNRAEIIVLSEV